MIAIIGLNLALLVYIVLNIFGILPNISKKK